MRLAVYGPDRRVGVLTDGWMLDAAGLLGGDSPGGAAPCCDRRGMNWLIEGGSELLEALAARLEEIATGGTEAVEGRYRVPAADAWLWASYPSLSSRFMMTGANNAAHVANYYRRHGSTATDEEFAQQLRDAGIMGFWKFPHNAAGPDGEIAHPGSTRYLDYEAEVAVVIGRRAKNVAPEAACDYIWGYTILNDLGLRYEDETKPYNLGVTKNFDGALAVGPAIVAGEAFDIGSITFESLVNGELRQSGNTKEMVFPFEELIAHFSSVTTLHPGDVISGGTCVGTAADSSDTVDGQPDRSRFLKPGDVVEVRSPGVGVLRNVIVTATDQP